MNIRNSQLNKMHQQKVRQIAANLQSNHQALSIVKDSVSHQVPYQYKRQAKKINISGLDQILVIDQKNKIVVAESAVTFSDLVKQSLKYNLAPAIVPELKTITVGGAVSGCSTESMSYKYGGFHDICMEYEIVTPNGQIITASNTKNRQVFNMVHGSFGSLGIITKVKSKLIDAKAYVAINYQSYSNIDQFIKAIEKEYQQPKHDFMDSIIHANNQFVLCLADFVDSVPHLSNYSKDKIYYKSTRQLTTDYLTTYDYYFRFDADCHWISRNYGLENPLIRKLFANKYLGSSKMIKAADKYKLIFSKQTPQVTLDTFHHISKFKHFYDWFSQQYNFYPIWIVPYKMDTTYPWINKKYLGRNQSNLYIDFAIYGMKQNKRAQTYLDIDKELLTIGSIKTLISYNQYKESTFWRIYDQKAYIEVKAKLDPDNIFPDLYSKVNLAKNI